MFIALEGRTILDKSGNGHSAPGEPPVCESDRGTINKASSIIVLPSYDLQ